MEGPQETAAFWFTELQKEGFQTSTELKRIMFDAQSEFQKVKVIETETFGKTLVLDGKTQSALLDEFIYHETLVHAPMLSHPNPKKVFIGGGGEFATAREVLKHRSVEKCVMVDIDKVVCDVCLEQLPEWNAGVIDDPRFEVHYDDAKGWLERSGEKFDVIIMDIADPIEAGPGYMLYTKEFYNDLLKYLTPGGVFVTQSGPGAMLNFDECFSPIYQTLKTVFKQVAPYTADVPSFAFEWAFNLASENGLEYLEKSPEEMDAIVKERISGELKFYDGLSHRRIFSLTKPVRKGLEAEERIMTKDSNIYMF